MSLEIPNRPGMPTDPGSDASPEQLRAYDRDMMKYQDALQRYNRTVQMIQQQQMEEANMRSTLEKNKHDAVMAIIHNMKAG